MVGLQVTGYTFPGPCREGVCITAEQLNCAQMNPQLGQNIHIECCMMSTVLVGNYCTLLPYSLMQTDPKLTQYLLQYFEIPAADDSKQLGVDLNA